MPITSKLSNKLYETFGDEAAADMVDWMHTVDAQRAELRELNELNFSRFESRFSQAEATFEARFAQAEATFDARFSQAQATFDARFAQFQATFDARLATFDVRLAQFEARIVGRLEAKIEHRTSELMKWSFLFWVGAVASIAALAGVLN